MRNQADPFLHAEHTVGRWLDAVAQRLETDDRRYAHRVLRAWLHVVRDRLTVPAAAHLGAQLPVLLRGIYYDGWTPGDMPARYDIDDFVHRYAHEAGIAPDGVPAAAGAVTAALRDLFSPGQLDHALAQLPGSLRGYLTEPGARSVLGEPERPGTQTRIARLEQAVDLLTRAVTELARGLEPTPLDEPEEQRGAKAARTVHQLLLTRSASA